MANKSKAYYVYGYDDPDLYSLDCNDGTLESPFKTLNHAISVSECGDRVYLICQRT